MGDGLPRGIVLDATELRVRDFARILLIKPSAFGDVVHTIPVLAKLRARYPLARIDWLITPENADLVRLHPALSNVVLFPRKQLGRDWAATWAVARLLRDLRRSRYDLVVDLHGQFRSALFAMASGAPTRIGFDRPRPAVTATDRRPSDDVGLHGWFGAREGAWVAYTHRIPVPRLDVHAVDRYLWLGDLLGFDDEPPEFLVNVPPVAVERVGQLLSALPDATKPLAVVVPGTIWETKHWTIAGFARVARDLMGAGMAVVLAGAPADRDRCRAIAGLCPGALDISGQTSLAELAALIRRASVCVTNDSGSMHLAVALDRPVTSVFGPTDPVKIGPYGRPDSVVRVDVPCSPCYLRRLHTCPRGHVCMERVTPDMVTGRALRVMSDGR
jgi:lipopolysaccharide heptosyltransferase I